MRILLFICLFIACSTPTEVKKKSVVLPEWGQMKEDILSFTGGSLSIKNETGKSDFSEFLNFKINEKPEWSYKLTQIPKGLEITSFPQYKNLSLTLKEYNTHQGGIAVCVIVKNGSKALIQRINIPPGNVPYYWGDSQYQVKVGLSK